MTESSKSSQTISSSNKFKVDLLNKSHFEWLRKLNHISSIYLKKLTNMNNGIPTEINKCAKDF